MKLFKTLPNKLFLQVLRETFWHNNFGTPTSHGCVNMTREDAGWLYNWAGLGTLVNVHN